MATIDKKIGLVIGPQGPQGPQGNTGPQGATGATGATPNLTIGTVTTLEPDASATASITGTAEDPVLNLGIPRGQTGEVAEEEFTQLKEDLKLVDDGLYSDILSYSQFVQGVRYTTNAGVIVPANNRCTMPYGICAKKGDVITISSIPTGFRAALVSLNGYESGWKTDSFTYTSNYDTEFFVNVSTSDGTSQLTPSDFEMTVTKKDNTSRISELESYDFNKRFSIDNSDIPWEIGGITATSNGWSYNNTTKRVRTPENYTIHLLKNSTVQMTDYTDSRFYPSCRKEDGTYRNYGWITSGIFRVVDEGDYVFTLSNKTEVTQTNPNNLGDLMKIEKSSTLQYVYSHTNNVADELKSDINKLQPDGLHSPLLIPCTPKFIMHRGYSTLAPENTAPAFELAGQGGTWGIETDIHETTDGFFVCFHDNDVDRMTDGTGNINEMTLAQVQALTIDAGNHIEEYPNEKIPTLEEFLSICRRYGCIAVLEWKYIINEGDMLNIIKNAGMEQSVIFLVGATSTCRRLRVYTDAPCALLGFDGSDDNTIINNASTEKNLWADIVSYRITDTSKPILAHSKNVPLIVYTVDNTTTADTLFRLGVDAIATNSIPKLT